MNTKLTLRLEESLIANAKEYAKKHGKSISQIVSDYFQAIRKKSFKQRTRKLRPISSKLCGSLKGLKITERDYKEHLHRKYL